MATYAVRKIFQDRSEAVVNVITDRCVYKVELTKDEVEVTGPGVDTAYEDIPQDWSVEGRALYAVIRFEEEA